MRTPRSTPSQQAVTDKQGKTPMAVLTKDGKPRKAPVRRPPIIVLQVLNEDGEPMEFNKKRIKTVAVTTDSDKALEIMESGRYPNAVYIRAATTE